MHFLDVDRIVGCREEELIDAEEAWIASAFEARERVCASRILLLGNDLRVPRAVRWVKSSASCVRTLKAQSSERAIVYHIHFDCLPGRTLAVPEAALMSLAES